MQTLKLERTRARDQIRQMLREMIVSGEFAGGERLDEVGLSGRIGVSRTPLREGLIALEEEGLVSSRPNRGFVVAVVDAPLVREIYPILAALEGAAVELSGSRLYEAAPQLREVNARIKTETRPNRRHALDREFHRALCANCGNERLLQLIGQHWNQARRIDGGERRGMANPEGSYAEHLAIIQKIERREFAEAAQLLRKHWLNGIAVVLRWMDQAP